MALVARMSRILDKALAEGAGYCDMRTERRRGLSLEFRDGELHEAIPGDERGLCIRVLMKGAWGISSTNDLSKVGIERAVSSALKLARTKAARKKRGDEVRLAPVRPQKKQVVWNVKVDPRNIPLEQKYRYLAEISRRVQGAPSVTSVTARYFDMTRSMELLSSEGADVRMELTRSLADVSMVVKSERGILSNRATVGGTAGWELHDGSDLAQRGVLAARTALEMLNGRTAPSGRFPVVADPVLTGVFAHEAVGHACEGDIIVAGDSCLKGKLGKCIASPILSLFDDPSIQGAFGSFPFDDEGLPARKKPLIEKGVLEGLILDRESAFRLGLEPNGGARAESYAARPLVRMSNTAIAAGDHSREEIFEGIKLGIYAVGTRGGQVDTAKGSFQFSCREAYLIEKGEIAGPLRSLALSGRILETLKEVDAIGKDLRIEDPGYCGKGQTVPVGDGGPHIRIRMAFVGGG
jgi:TldD protein